MNAPSRSAVVAKGNPRLTEAVRDVSVSPVDVGPPSSSTARARSEPPRLTVPRYCRVKGCGKRIVRGRLGFLAFVHAEKAPFPHYAKG